ncbi:MAG: MaoC family dehydratase [bacterium]|nr:MaoC family dehydratase [bacterium]
MNRYTYQEIEVGQKEHFTVTVTEEDQAAFCRITGDINPLHQDPAYAQEKGHKGCVVYGMLTASYYSTLAGVYLPGERSLVHSVKSKFLKPVYIGDTLFIEGTVTEKNDTFQMITVKAVIQNQDGVKVSKAELQIGLI